ncbi:MAG TPA: cation diffusion facilitator family transporter [Longimicrobiales bacterium]
MSLAPETRRREVRRVLIITFFANIIVVIGKLFAGHLAHSLAIIADAAHSSVDAWSNVMALLLARVAAKAPDAEHPYGHAKFETLGAIGIVAFLSIAVFELVSGAVRRLGGVGGHPEPNAIAVGVMVASAIISLLVARYEDRYGHAYNSEILIADAAHTKSDFYASLAVLAGLGLIALGYPQADAVVTILVAAVIARAGFRILKRTVPILVDERAVEEEEIRRIALQMPGVLACFDVRSRGRAGEIFAELTVAVAPTLNVSEAHLIADAVEREVASAVGAREVVAHVEPYEEESARAQTA